MKARLKNLLLRIFLISYSIIVCYPLVWNLISSFKTNEEILTSPISLPSSLQFENYVNAFLKANMGAYFFNSVFVVIVSVIILLVLCVPVSFALSRFRFFGAKVILSVYMACIFIQPSFILVPLFLQLNDFHMLDNRLWLSLIYAVLQLPFSIFLLSGFIRSISAEYENAAMIDGCTTPQIMTKVIIPMARPGIVTVVMLTAMGFWNEYPIALTLISSPDKKTIPIGLANLYEVQRYATEWGALFAALIIVIVPTIVLFIIGQDKLAQGMNMGGLKG